MSLDDLFGLLLFALFIGVPLLSRFLRRGPPAGKAPPPTTSTTRTGLPTTPPTQAPQTRRDTAKNTAENAADDIAERLEQARRRVREAVEGQSARADTRTARNPSLGPTGLESAGDMFRQEPVPTTPPVSAVVVSTLQRPGTARRPSGGQGVSRRATRPLQVERSLSGKRAKLSSNMLTFDREDILRGIVWQQILDAPKSKRPWRTPSQHP